MSEERARKRIRKNCGEKQNRLFVTFFVNCYWLILTWEVHDFGRRLPNHFFFLTHRLKIQKIRGTIYNISYAKRERSILCSMIFFLGPHSSISEQLLGANEKEKAVCVCVLQSGAATQATPHQTERKPSYSLFCSYAVDSAVAE